MKIKYKSCDWIINQNLVIITKAQLFIMRCNRTKHENTTSERFKLIIATCDNKLPLQNKICNLYLAKNKIK